MKRIICKLLFLVFLLLLFFISANVYYYQRHAHYPINFFGERYSLSNSSTDDKPNRSFQVPILMYHYIREIHSDDSQTLVALSVSPTTFEKQLIWLKNNNYYSISPSDLTHGLSAIHDGQKPIIISFDDGYRSAYEQAYPLLKKYNFLGVFYLIVGSVGDGAYMNWTQIKEMYENGMIIGSHSISHPNLVLENDTELISQINGSRSLIKDHIGITVTDFCYPGGHYDDRVENQVKALNYQTAVTVDAGTANQNSDLFALPRYSIREDSDFNQLLK